MKGSVELRKVTFSYPERPKIMVFQDFDLVVDAGKTVALCGQSGSGKSSIVALILRFYDPLSGAVSLLQSINCLQFHMHFVLHTMMMLSARKLQPGGVERISEKM